MSEWTPCGHVPPLKPIELNPRHPVTPSPEKTMGQAMLDAMAQSARDSEAVRIWKITRAVAEGTNPPTGRE